MQELLAQPRHRTAHRRGRTQLRTPDGRVAASRWTPSPGPACWKASTNWAICSSTTTRSDSSSSASNTCTSLTLRECPCTLRSSSCPVTASARKSPPRRSPCCDAVGQRYHHQFTLQEHAIGGVAIDATRRAAAGRDPGRLPQGRRDPARRGRRPEVVGARRQGPAGTGPAGAAQGAWPVCQPASGAAAPGRARRLADQAAPAGRAST